MPPPKPEGKGPEKDKTSLQARRALALRRKRALERRRRQAATQEDNDDVIQGLSSTQISMLAQKVFDLWRDELRLEAERFGRNSFR